jgi:hypothetical protein
MSFEYVDPRFIVERYRGKGKSLRFFLNKWASTFCDTANRNAEKVNSKEKQLNYMYSCVIIGLAILAKSFLLLAINLTGKSYLVMNTRFQKNINQFLVQFSMPLT